MSIGVTQRVEICENYGEVRDCLDQEWTNLINVAGFDLVIIPNAIRNIENWLENKNVSGIILTGGNDLSHLINAKNPAPNRDETERKILKWVSKNKVPVLGVCRGMQLMNDFLSGSLSRIEFHSGLNHEIKVIENKIISESLSSVNSYHDWGIFEDDLSPKLKVIATASDGSIEAVEHRYLPWIGVMWHPERGNSKALTLNRNVMLLNKIFSK